MIPLQDHSHYGSPYLWVYSFFFPVPGSIYSLHGAKSPKKIFGYDIHLESEVLSSVPGVLALPTYVKVRLGHPLFIKFLNNFFFLLK